MTEIKLLLPLSLIAAGLIMMFVIVPNTIESTIKSNSPISEEYCNHYSDSQSVAWRGYFCEYNSTSRDWHLNQTRYQEYVGMVK